MRSLALIPVFLCAQSGRYWDSLFAWEIETIPYGEAITALGTRQVLYADFYLPREDIEQQRPVIVLLFGGGYISGSRRDADITHLAKYFAARGYVAATIDYRIGGFLPTATEWINASLRAMHDLKAFIRYLKRSVVEGGNPHGIDTARIYVGGSSAGAFTALHAAYLTTPEELAEIPQVDTTFLRSQGGIEGNSGNPGYSSRFAGVFSLSGGMLHTGWISPSRVSALIAMHGTADPTVPYKRGSLPIINLQAEGGYNLDSVAASRGLYHALFTWVGAGHVPYGTQVSIAPVYMRDVEEFLRYHFYNWNSRYTTGLDATTVGNESIEYEVWSIDGRYVGKMSLEKLPSGVWALRGLNGDTRRVYRP